MSVTCLLVSMYYTKRMLTMIYWSCIQCNNSMDKLGKRMCKFAYIIHCILISFVLHQKDNNEFTGISYCMKHFNPCHHFHVCNMVNTPGALIHGNIEWLNLVWAFYSIRRLHWSTRRFNSPQSFDFDVQQWFLFFAFRTTKTLWPRNLLFSDWD